MIFFVMDISACGYVLSPRAIFKRGYSSSDISTKESKNGLEDTTVASLSLTAFML